MKITKFKLFVITIIFTVLFLITLTKVTKRRKHKKTSFRFKNPEITNAKNKCKNFCDEELKLSKKSPLVKDPAKSPSRVVANLHQKKNKQDHEYFLCECQLRTDNTLLKREFYFVNKNNLDAWFKQDDDGRKVYLENMIKYPNKNYIKV